MIGRFGYRRGIPMVLACGFAVLGIFGIPASGFGAAGAWVLTAFGSALLLSWIGGNYRVFYTATAVIPPYVFLSVLPLLGIMEGVGTGEDITDGVMLALIFVLCPIGIAWGISWLIRLNRTQAQ